LVVGLVNGLAAGEAAHQMNQYVDFLKPGRYFVGQTASRLAARQLGGHGGKPRMRKVGRLNRSGNANDRRPRLEESLGDKIAEASLGAGDECNFLIERRHVDQKVALITGAKRSEEH